MSIIDLGFMILSCDGAGLVRIIWIVESKLKLIKIRIRMLHGKQRFHAKTQRRMRSRLCSFASLRETVFGFDEDSRREKTTPLNNSRSVDCGPGSKRSSETNTAQNLFGQRQVLYP